ncbi:MAG: hypothetical protein ACKESB_03655 [Candidatus Hodgkinia cicadicola]
MMCVRWRRWRKRREQVLNSHRRTPPSAPVALPFYATPLLRRVQRRRCPVLKQR